MVNLSISFFMQPWRGDDRVLQEAEEEVLASMTNNANSKKVKWETSRIEKYLPSSTLGCYDPLHSLLNSLKRSTEEQNKLQSMYKLLLSQWVFSKKVKIGHLHKILMGDWQHLNISENRNSSEMTSKHLNKSI